MTYQVVWLTVDYHFQHGEERGDLSQAQGLYAGPMPNGGAIAELWQAEPGGKRTLLAWRSNHAGLKSPTAMVMQSITEATANVFTDITEAAAPWLNHLATRIDRVGQTITDVTNQLKRRVAGRLVGVKKVLGTIGKQVHPEVWQKVNEAADVLSAQIAGTGLDAGRKEDIAFLDPPAPASSSAQAAPPVCTRWRAVVVRNGVPDQPLAVTYATEPEMLRAVRLALSPEHITLTTSPVVSPDGTEYVYATNDPAITVAISCAMSTPVPGPVPPVPILPPPPPLPPAPGPVPPVPILPPPPLPYVWPTITQPCGVVLTPVDVAGNRGTAYTDDLQGAVAAFNSANLSLGAPALGQNLLDGLVQNINDASAGTGFSDFFGSADSYGFDVLVLDCPVTPPPPEPSPVPLPPGHLPPAPEVPPPLTVAAGGESCPPVPPCCIEPVEEGALYPFVVGQLSVDQMNRLTAFYGEASGWMTAPSLNALSALGNVGPASSSISPDPTLALTPGMIWPDNELAGPIPFEEAISASEEVSQHG